VNVGVQRFSAFGLLILLFFAGVGMLGRAREAQESQHRDTTPDLCDRLGIAWRANDGWIIIDRRVEKRLGILKAAYRLDDKNGYWLYPGSDADVVALPEPKSTTDQMRISIITMTDTRGVVRACRSAGRPLFAQPPPTAASLRQLGVAKLTARKYVDDRLPCGHVFEIGTVLDAVAPDTPLEAAFRGIHGTVTVELALDASGEVTSAVVTKSPSPILNAPAILAAERSRFSPTLFRCRPIADRYNYLVVF